MPSNEVQDLTRKLDQLLKRVEELERRTHQLEQRLALRWADHPETVIPTTCPPAADAPSDAAAIAPS